VPHTSQPYRPNLGLAHVQLLSEITEKMNTGALSHWSNLDTLRRMIEAAWVKTHPDQPLPANLPHKAYYADLDM
jgi:hypothetical protein